MAQGTNARRKGFNLFKDCPHPPLPSHTRRVSCAPPPVLLAHRGYSSQLCTITPSFMGMCLTEYAITNEKVCSLTFKNRCAHDTNTGMTTRCKQREKIFKSWDRSAGSISQSMRPKTHGDEAPSKKAEIKKNKGLKQSHQYLVFWHHHDSYSMHLQLHWVEETECKSLKLDKPYAKIHMVIQQVNNQHSLPVSGQFCGQMKRLVHFVCYRS